MWTHCWSAICLHPIYSVYTSSEFYRSYLPDSLLPERLWEGHGSYVLLSMDDLRRGPDDACRTIVCSRPSRPRPAVPNSSSPHSRHPSTYTGSSFCHQTTNISTSGQLITEVQHVEPSWEPTDAVDEGQAGQRQTVIRQHGSYHNTCLEASQTKE